MQMGREPLKNAFVFITNLKYGWSAKPLRHNGWSAKGKGTSEKALVFVVNLKYGWSAKPLGHNGWSAKGKGTIEKSLVFVVIGKRLCRNQESLKLYGLLCF